MTFRVGDRARIKVWGVWTHCTVEKTASHGGDDMALVLCRARRGSQFSEWRFMSELRFPHGGDGDIA